MLTRGCQEDIGAEFSNLFEKTSENKKSSQKVLLKSSIIGKLLREEREGRKGGGGLLRGSPYKKS